MVDELRESLAKLSDTPLTEWEKDDALNKFCGVLECLMDMWKELKDQGYSFNEEGQMLDPNGEVLESKYKCKHNFEPYRIEDKDN